MTLETHLSTEQQLVEHLQELLDIQWDSLISARGSQLEYTRHEILHSMSQLTYKVFEPKKRLLQSIIDEDHNLIETSIQRQKQTKTTESEIESIVNEKKPELDQLDEEIKTNDQAIVEMEAKLQQLQKRKQQLISQKSSIEESIESKTSSLKHRLTVLQKEQDHSEDDYSIQARIDVTQESLDKTELEINALKQGTISWTQVISLVQTLEENMKSASSAQDLFDLLIKAQHDLQEYLSLATQKKWTLLSVAISHEYEAISQGIEMLRTKGITEETSPDESSS